MRQQIKQIVLGCCILILVHYKWGFVQPLFLQCVLPFKNLFDAKVVKVHLLGQKAEGELQRPFKADRPFGNMFDEQGLASTGRQGRRAEQRREVKEERKKN